MKKILLITLYSILNWHTIQGYTYTFDNLTPYPLFVSITGVAAIPSAKGSMFGERNPDGSIRAKMIESGDSIEFHGTGWEIGICLDGIRIKFTKKTTDKNGETIYTPTSYHPITKKMIDPNVEIIVLPNHIYSVIENAIQEFTTATTKNIANMVGAGENISNTEKNDPEDSIAAIATTSALIADLALTIETGGISPQAAAISSANILKDSVEFGFNLYKNGMCRNRVFRIIETIDKPGIVRKGKVIQPEERSLKIITSQ